MFSKLEYSKSEHNIFQFHTTLSRTVILNNIVYRVGTTGIRVYSFFIFFYRYNIKFNSDIIRQKCTNMNLWWLNPENSLLHSISFRCLFPWIAHGSRFKACNINHCKYTITINYIINEVSVCSAAIVVWYYIFTMDVNWLYSRAYTHPTA